MCHIFLVTALQLVHFMNTEKNKLCQQKSGKMYLWTLIWANHSAQDFLLVCFARFSLADRPMSAICLSTLVGSISSAFWRIIKVFFLETSVGTQLQVPGCLLSVRTCRNMWKSVYVRRFGSFVFSWVTTSKTRKSLTTQMASAVMSGIT